MKHFKFRCSKVVFEEKKGVRLIGGDEVHSHETTVAVYFEQADEPTKLGHGYAYISLTISDEQFKELGYRVGQEYMLATTIALDSVTQG